MMHYRAATASLALLALAAGAVAASMALLESSHEERRRHWHEAERQALIIRQSASRLPVSATGAPAPEQLGGIARDAMQRAGIDASALVAIEPLATVTFPGGLWAQQTVQLRMRSVETPQFARLMANLDVVGASWAVGGVQLLHVGPGDRYDAGLTMTTLYPLDP